jgi:hypothetical protein
MIITPRSRNGIDVVAAVAVGKVKKRCRFIFMASGGPQNE